MNDIFRLLHCSTAISIILFALIFFFAKKNKHGLKIYTCLAITQVLFLISAYHSVLTTNFHGSDPAGNGMLIGYTFFYYLLLQTILTLVTLTTVCVKAIRRSKRKMEEEEMEKGLQ